LSTTGFLFLKLGEIISEVIGAVFRQREQSVPSLKHG